jgi:hypothetical protein
VVSQTFLFPPFSLPQLLQFVLKILDLLRHFHLAILNEQKSLKGVLKYDVKLNYRKLFVFFLVLFIHTIHDLDQLFMLHVSGTSLALF